MGKFTPSLKHHILTQYQPHSRTHNFAALARLYAVKGGESTIRKWHLQWNRTPASLEHKKGAGRPRKLTRTQANNLIHTPIKNKRRAHRAVHYTDLHSSIKQKLGCDISIRSIRVYGKRDFGIKMKTAQKRTATEREYNTSSHTERESEEGG